MRNQVALELEADRMAPTQTACLESWVGGPPVKIVANLRSRADCPMRSALQSLLISGPRSPAKILARIFSQAGRQPPLASHMGARHTAPGNEDSSSRSANSRVQLIWAWTSQPSTCLAKTRPGKRLSSEHPATLTSHSRPPRAAAAPAEAKDGSERSHPQFVLAKRSTLVTKAALAMGAWLEGVGHIEGHQARLLPADGCDIWTAGRSTPKMT